MSDSDSTDVVENIATQVNSSNESNSNQGFAFDSLESVRKKLLDLTGRNSLISYRHPKASCIRLIDELPDQIFDVLNSAKEFTFIPVPEPTKSELIEAGYIEPDPISGEMVEREYPTAEKWAKHIGLDTRYDLPDVEIADDNSEKHQDTNLQTLLYSAELESRLRGIRSKAETAIEESGSNILYLALGFLEWFESRDSDVSRLAPLFTIPVRLERERVASAYRYKLSIKDDGLLSNITFREKLAHDFNLVLPLIEEDETTPEQYFQTITNTILKEKPRWRLRRQASLVLLNYAKQAMYLDLDPDNWPNDDRIDEHDLIKMFFSSNSRGESGDGSSFETEHPIDHIEEVHHKFPLIYDADSSQHSALIDAVDGNNLVIEGPPGSGKSQTITNLISACIANGKKVLFVAEKMAALDVVKNRLDKAGLGDFCLELHSHKTHKLKILQNLSIRINKQGEYRSPKTIDADIERYEDLRSKLHKYVDEINSNWGSTGLTVHEILNKATRYREHYGINPDLLIISGIDGESLSVVKLKELTDQADMLANIYDQVSEQARDGVIENHYWYGVDNHNLKGYEIDELCTILKSWTDNLKSLNSYWNETVSSFTGDTNKNISILDIKKFVESLGELPDLEGNELISEIEYIHNNHDEVSDALEQYKSIHHSIDDIKFVVKENYINIPDSKNTLYSSLKSLQQLGVSLESGLDSITNDVSILDRLATLLKTVSTQFDQIKSSISGGLKPCFEDSRKGLKEFNILVGLIDQLPVELWRHRDNIFDNPDIDNLLNQLTANLKDLTPVYKELIDEFSLHRLPDSRELIKYQAIFDDAGFFRIFSGEWRSARKSVLELSAKPKTNKKTLLNFLPKLITYAQGIERIDKLNKEDPLLEKVYKGVETPVDRIIQLRKWYQLVRNEYGIGFGDRVSIGNALINLDRNLAVSISDVSRHGLLDEVNDSNKFIDRILNKYTEYQELKDDHVQLSGELSPLVKLRLSLSKNLESLSDIVVGESTVINDLLSANEKLNEIHKNVSSWLKNKTTQYLVPNVLPLSIRVGGYSDKCYMSGFNTLKISSVLAGSNYLKSAVLNNSTNDGYCNLKNSCPVANKVYSAVIDSSDRFVELGKVDINEWLDSSSDGINNVIQRNEDALDNVNWLNTWLDYLKLREKLNSKGLNNIIKGLESEKIQTKDIKDIVQLVIFHQLSEEIFENHKYLSEFSGMEQMAIRKKYQEYDRNLMKLQREKIAYQSSRKNPAVGNSTGRVSSYSELSLIKHEAGKKTRHIAVRSLLKRSGDAIQTLKPCFMMSPMSVAQYLKPGEFKFDLIVMDEASQIRPEDALGSIARAKKLIVVGDPKQLPPTSFFSKTFTNEDDDDSVALEESESILEAVIPMFKTRRLRWHYRSRHESLIAFSNQQFYDSNLILFPSPFQESDEFGIRYKRVTRGRFHNRRNVEEAREIVKSVALQLQNNPKESVGIVAMNAEQMAEIELQLDQLIKDEPLLADAWDKNRSLDEPLFIKNLENVQGDERDVIIISMTYGPEQVGGRTMQRFGPINSNVGWRRLNVLFTRSKKRMHIFSSMGSGDILVSGTSSRGVQSLRYFLEYCETGHMHHAKHTGKPADSDFEIAVMNELAKHGYECEPQLGVAGYFLDLAVRDPGKPGRFLMGVECDGATYHSAKSTRDRDRLRQDILENLGWRIRRIWSTDWFKNPQAQIQPIVQELDRLKTPISEDQEFVLEQQDIVQEEAPSIVQESLELSTDSYQEELEEDVDLKDRLISFGKNVIQKAMPDVDKDHRLLRPAMIEALLNHLPCSKAEFLEQIPGYLRTGTDVVEAQKYLEDVLELVADYG